MNVPEKMNFIKEIIDPQSSDKILNIGIGWEAQTERMLEENIAEIWGADIDTKKIKLWKPRLKKTRIVYFDAGIELKGELKKKENYFDKIILLEVAEHIKNDFQVMKNINKLLKKDGKLIISVPTICFAHSISPLNYYAHYRHYSKNSLTKLLEKTRFKIKEIHYVGNWLFNFNLYWSLIVRYVFKREFKLSDSIFTKSYGKSWGKGRKEGMSIILKAIKI